MSMTRALAAWGIYIPAHHNSGDGRTAETGNRTKQQQIDRSEDNKRTRARGTEITGGMASEGEWTTSPAKRQVAAAAMRVGQQGGPLPFEAIIASDEPIVNILHGGVTATVRDALREIATLWRKRICGRTNRNFKARPDTEGPVRWPCSGGHWWAFRGALCIGVCVRADKGRALGTKFHPGLRATRLASVC
jgi:hypothetical protein